MNLKFHLPTTVIGGKGCVRANAARFGAFGGRALIVTGAKSSKRNGAGADIEAALASQGVAFRVFDEVGSNPGLGVCRRAADSAREFRADFVVAIGGGSPIDAAKAIAILARNELSDEGLFKGPYPSAALPIVAVPTTAGTGSEVTQYAILADESAQGAGAIVWDGVFPALAFLDCAYTASLSHRAASSAALDALSHSVEGYLALSADPWSRALANEALLLFGRALPRLADGYYGEELRSDLLLAANMSGTVIAQTATTIVHAMGYSLTYFKDIDHGRANGLILGPYLDFIAESNPGGVRAVLDALLCRNVDAFMRLLESLLGERETISSAEIQKFTAIALKARQLGNTARRPRPEDIERLYASSLRPS